MIGRWIAGVSLAVMGIATAGAANADDLTATDPIGLLDGAETELTDANQVLSEIPTQGNLNLAAEVANLTGSDDTTLQLLGHLETFEDKILANDGSLSVLINPLLTNLDQNWYNATEGLLSADQALDAAALSGSGLQAAELGVAAADFQMLGPVFDSIPVAFASLLF